MTFHFQFLCFHADDETLSGLRTFFGCHALRLMNGQCPADNQWNLPARVPVSWCMVSYDPERSGFLFLYYDGDRGRQRP